ncbi:diphosphomevalonate decarboxylase [Legionella gratiana]|uniref:Diphosphomevalonate decarboxylase n=1 Tax=Legionella gratiana TaxID=45066 RepID=A0A378JB23_9GAMM|nr:diphosphomevalonate decarboxylase [Legionella gratiana]KTD10864.1 diphosphomevalonate decarboxylase [Legionella gratiana]STX44087.1 diphosphomevalonate decarboxylase [Legionella gratiana]
MYWLAHAPANIALIKYMGKKDESSNAPDNSSLSYTLNDLISTVRLEKLSSKKDIWEPLIVPGGIGELVISQEGQKKFLDHLTRIKKYFDYEGGFLVQSCNNFPHSSGMASSASSFAALTRCASIALSELTQKPMPSIDEQAQLSRLGSGSSCRSFYSPWALWQENKVEAIDLPYQQLLYQGIVVSNKKKEVSSSEAHKRVKASPFYATRTQEAEENLKLLLTALMSKDWCSAYHICWREFQNMHRLFHTCEPPFSYMTENSVDLLHHLEDFWDKKGDGPIITMDAGPNIHLLYRPEQQELAREFKRDYLVGNYDVL